MGVVYKLNPQVIEYIVGQKKDIPQISCRKLADLVSEKFQVKVSKSSINSILKGSHLSSPVGRRSRSEKKDKKFEIPDHQKKRISEGLRKAVPPPQPEPPQELPPEPPLPRKIPSVEPLTKQELCDGMGSFILKAAQWELSNQPLLAEFLRGFVNVRFLADLHPLSDILLFLPLFDIQSPESLSRYCGRGLWALSGLEGPLNSRQIIDFAQSFQNIRTLSVKMSNEKSQIFSEIGGFKFELQDKTEFLIDAQLLSTWSQNVHSLTSAPIKKAITTLSEVFVGNVQPVIVNGISGKESFAGSFYQMLAAFENVHGKKIEKVALLDRQSREVANFPSVPDKKRLFMTCAWPWHKEFEELSKDDPGRPRYFFSEAFGSGIYYSEMEIHLRLPTFDAEKGGAFPLRVVFLRNELKGRAVAALLSNIPAGELSAESLVGKYVERWPNMQEGFLEFLDNIKESGDHGRREGVPREPAQAGGRPAFGHPDIWHGIQTLLEDLNDYCQRHFFPKEYEQYDLETMKARFYSLPGQAVEGDYFLKVALAPEEGFKDMKGLEYAVRRINENNIHNNFGKRLVLTILK